MPVNAVIKLIAAMFPHMKIKDVTVIVADTRLWLHTNHDYRDRENR